MQPMLLRKVTRTDLPKNKQKQKYYHEYVPDLLDV